MVADAVRVYANEFHARQAFLAGDVGTVVGIVRRRVDAVPRVNLARWQGWLEPFASYTAESGDLARAGRCLQS
jgi:hypothetical protein